MIKIGDYVTRISYNHDIVFKVVDIIENNCILCGACVRLDADSDISDLEVYVGKLMDDDSFACSFDTLKTLDRSEYFYLPGKILHIDGDKDFLEKSMKFYRKNKIKAYGFYMCENEIKDKVYGYLKKYNPDILVMTGHDAYRKKRNFGYKNTSYFVEAVHEARKYEKSHEKLIIIAGACQSNYEELIKAGANFASSPKRVNIHVLDPSIIAVSMAFSDKNNNIDLIDILDRTKYGSSGIGGIITKGTMYVGFPRE